MTSEPKIGKTLLYPMATSDGGRGQVSRGAWPFLYQGAFTTGPELFSKKYMARIWKSRINIVL
jgi:hypothetical protein